MSRKPMHDDHVLTDAGLVGRLLAEQFPAWAGLPVHAVPSHGTDHDIYRIGDRLAARMPRVASAMAQATKEAAWLPRLAPRLPLALPVPVATGQPHGDYPYTWSVYEWLPGADATGSLADLDQAAADLAGFIMALQKCDPAGAPERGRGSRGGPLIDNDDGVRRSIADLGDRIDGAAVTRLWDESLAAPAWDGPDVWIHGDLLPGNLLVDGGGRLSAVIDFAVLTVGDPGCDLLPAWNLFTGSSRDRFRAELDVDDACWLRGRGWALTQAVVALPHYWDTNPGMVRQASRALGEIAGAEAVRR